MVARSRRNGKRGFPVPVPAQAAGSPIVTAGLLVFLLIAAAPRKSAAQNVTAELDRSETVLGSPVTLTIRVEGGTPGSPQLPPLDGWKVRYIGQESSFSVVNMAVTRSVAFNYLFTPLKTGSLKIPPIPVTVDGRRLETPALLVRVLGANQPRSTAPAQGDTGASRASDSAGGDDVIVEIELDPPIAYVGQMIRQTLRIYTAVPVGDSIQVGRTKIPGTVEEEDVAASQRRYTATRNGRSYRVEEVSWVFYPVTVGSLVIPPIDVTVPVVTRSRHRRGYRIDPFFDDFFGRGTRVEPRGYRTEQRTIVVRPVPEDGRPPGYSGLVGRYTISSTLSEPELALGDSTTMTITVRGEGNLRNLVLPSVDDKRVKVYEDSPEVSVHLDEKGRVISEKAFKHAIVPQVSGKIELPPTTIVFFNPDAGRFETASSAPVRLRVSPGPNGESTLPGSTMVQGAIKKAIEVTGEDILPIHAATKLSARRSLIITSPGVLVALGIVPGLFLVSLWISSVRRKRYGDEALRRRRTAMRNARTRLKQARVAAKTGDRQTLEALSKALRGYLGDKLGIEGGALIAREARDLLSARGVDETLAQEAGALLDEIERARYAPGGAGAEAGPLLTRTRRLLGRLEKALG